MSKFLQLLIIGLLVSAASMASRADACKYSAKREATIDVQAAKRVAISARAGSLSIEGVPNAARVEASGLACASTEKFLEQVLIETRREGDVLHVDVRIPDLDSQSGSGTESRDDDDEWWKHHEDRYASLDIRITVPEKLPVTAIDSSGDARVRRVASLEMTDSSGELRIEDVAGDVAVRDSSGELTLRKIGGNVELNDSSGDVLIDRVGKNVKVEVDSSGDLEIGDVKGSVQIEQDSSGDIRVGDVTGGVSIGSDGSGGVDVHHVGGAFSLGSKGSGDVQFADIKGDVHVPER
jgi:hypothetical protein